MFRGTYQFNLYPNRPFALSVLQVKPKMILLLVASVMVVENKLRGAAAFVSDEEGQDWVNVEQGDEEYYEAEEEYYEPEEIGGGGGGGGGGEY